MRSSSLTDLLNVFWFMEYTDFYYAVGELDGGSSNKGVPFVQRTQVGRGCVLCKKEHEDIDYFFFKCEYS